MITDIDRLIAIVPAVEDITALLQIDEFGKADLPSPEINGTFAFPRHATTLLEWRLGVYEIAKRRGRRHA
jgi:hypothetical protein